MRDQKRTFSTVEGEETGNPSLYQSTESINEDLYKTKNQPNNLVKKFLKTPFLNSGNNILNLAKKIKAGKLLAVQLKQQSENSNIT